MPIIRRLLRGVIDQYRHGAFPAPVAGLAALGPIGQLLAYPRAVTDSAAFAADGALGFWVPFITFVGFLAISGSLLSQVGRGPAAGGTAAQ